MNFYNQNEGTFNNQQDRKYTRILQIHSRLIPRCILVHCKQSWQMPRRFFLEVFKPLGCVPNSTQVTGRKHKFWKTTCCCSNGHFRLLGLIQNVLLECPMRYMKTYSGLYEHLSSFPLHKRSHAT